MEKFLSEQQILILIFSGIISILTSIITTQVSEKLKAKCEKTTYISKVQFDVELKVYQELSEKSYNALMDCALLFPVGLTYVPEKEEERKKDEQELYLHSNQSTVHFQDSLYKYSPFIKKEIFEKFHELLNYISTQNRFFYSKITVEHFEFNILERENLTNKILDLHKKIIQELRDYLNSIKVEK